MNKQKQIALLDCNNFFVSCERLFRPDLMGRPVLVLSSNDGCVVARSQEVKDIGIQMSVPYFQIKDIVKEHNIHIFSGHLALYRDVSRRVFESLRSKVDTVEQYSIDEAFFTIPDGIDAADLIKKIKTEVETAVGIPVSIGVGYSKTQAKCASEMAKKAEGFHVFSKEDWLEKTYTIPVSSIWGVGRGMSTKFTEHGIKTVADLLAIPAERIGVLFGVVGKRLYAELSGTTCDPVENKRALQKSLMSTRSFAKSTQNMDILADAAAYHSRHIASDLRSMQAAATTIRISLRASRHGDFFLRGGTKETVFPAATNDTFALVNAAETAIQELYEPGVPYQKVGVTVVGIQPQLHAPQTLFEADVVDNSPLLEALDSINQAAGTEILTVGSRLKTKTWQSKSGMRSPAYTTRWSDIATVSS